MVIILCSFHSIIRSKCERILGGYFIFKDFKRKIEYYITLMRKEEVHSSSQGLSKDKNDVKIEET